MLTRRTEIAGCWVDFPIGLSASVFSGNSKQIEFYAQLGFDILTYKTVRTIFHEAHPLPNLVFLRDPQAISNTDYITFTGYPEYWPADHTTASMANSFGISSLAPNLWIEDVRRARNVVREGHQILIVSVVASDCQSKQSLIDDFVVAALLAKGAGADIVEANYSCPNTPDDQAVGELYKSAEVAGDVSRAIKEELGATPLLVKIGYLPEPELSGFFEYNKEYVDGIVAINTIPASIVKEDGTQVFPGREKAGVSGLVIRERAHEVAANLLKLRNNAGRQLSKKLNIFGLGGVLTSNDALFFLDSIGVDVVESCTGAFLNPSIALQTRLLDLTPGAGE